MSCSQSCAARCLSREASVTCGCVVTCSGEIPQRRIASRVASQSACSGGQSKGRATTAPDCGQYVRRSIEKPCGGMRAAADAKASSSAGVTRRSEEHTSELQSLMRISYAVFCLKKKKEKS